ncbi:MAG: hypothetical protein MUD04_13190 [Cyanobium sp. Prado107]|nr:hypothetical protein [Cyanobium sp. Prado107]
MKFIDPSLVILDDALAASSIKHKTANSPATLQDIDSLSSIDDAISTAALNPVIACPPVQNVVEWTAYELVVYS